MINPLDYRNSKEVKQLLHDLYTANFKKAQVDTAVVSDIINAAWGVDQSSSEDTRLRIASLFTQSKEQTRFKTSETFPMFLQDLADVRSFLDIGANKLETINSLSITQPQIKQLIAVDVIPQKTNFLKPEISEYIQVIDNQPLPLADDSIDFINIQFALHHFLDEQEIKQTLVECHRLLSPKGRLLLWEESFAINIEDVNTLTKQNNQQGILTDRELTNKFYQLSIQERWELIIFNDWLINTGNEHMQWTGQYRIWPAWVKFFEQNRLKLSQEHILGMRINGKLKQGVHILGVFKKV